MLLWNKELYPSPAMHRELAQVYALVAPELRLRYEELPEQLEVLEGLGRLLEQSGHFTGLQTGHTRTELTYTSAQYLRLLSTYSPYLKLEPCTRDALFEGLADVLEGDGGRLPLSYVSAFHVGTKL